MKNIFLLSLVSFFSAAAYSQKKDSTEVIIEKISGLQSFSVQADFYNDEVVDFGRGKSDIVRIFPQLKEMKMVKRSGDILVRITAHEPVDLAQMRLSADYAVEIKKFEAIRPMPVSQPANTIGYFQPFTLTLEKDGEILFSIRTIGDYFQLNLAANKSTDEIPTGFYINSYFLKSHKPERSVEFRNLQRNLKFLEVHLDVLK